MISVIVVNYNGRKFLADCLAALAYQTSRDFEVIVVDNGSDDGSDQVVSVCLPGAKLIRLGRNEGYAGAVNRGIREAGGEYIFTLNNDTRLDFRCIESLSSALSAEPKVGMLATKMVFPDGRINSAGICISRSGAAWDRGMFQKDTGQFDQEKEVFGPCGGAAIYRKDMLEEIGLFDDDFFLYMEDVDVALRGRLAGWRCLYAPSAVVLHCHGGTAGYNSDLSVYYGNRNILWYVVKDLPVGLLARYLPWIIGRNLGVIFYYSTKGQGLVALKAKADGIRGLTNMLKKRRSVIRKTSNCDIAGWIEVWSGIPPGTG